MKVRQGRAELELGPVAQKYKELFPEADLAGVEMNYVASRAFAAWNLTGQKSPQSGISAARYTVLRSLYFSEHRRLPLKEISKQTNVTLTNVIRHVDALQKAGLVERQQDVDDRRVTFAQLTEKGRRTIEALMPKAIEHSNLLWADFSDEELRIFKDLLNRFRERALLYRGQLWEEHMAENAKGLSPELT